MGADRWSARLALHSQFATPAPLGWFSTERGRVTNPATFGTVVVSEHHAVSPLARRLRARQ
ncbi:hypothetical protein SMJ63A_20248 [Stenotrophomonas geniculata]|nr:protein of unknown function [Stenotrophomonas maltophilia]